MSVVEFSREKQYQGQAFDVSKVHFQLPNGKERAYDLVEHVDSVTILPVDADGNIYFVSQYRIGAGDVLLELPAGVMDPKESPLDCAKREIREETGMAAGKIQELGSFYLAPGYTNEFMTVYLATELYEAPLDPDDDEFLQVIRLPKEEVFRRVFASEIKDGKTLATLLLAQPYLDFN